ncbi:MAG TPA: hypothetical protein VFZ61_19490 [Polyangiales bacterium]
MTSNTDMTERNQAGNGGPQGQQGGGPQTQQGGGPQQGTAAKAANLAANAATRQVEKTRERVVDRVAQQREQISSRVRSLSRALRGAGEMLEEDDIAGHALHYASDRVERVAGYVSELSPEGVAEDLRGVARTNPLWFFGGAFALGLVLGRFARSTGEGIEHSMEREQGMGGSTGGSVGGQERRQREMSRTREPQP